MPNLGLTTNLRILRKHYRYTQEDVSKYLNIERQTYTNYENGKRVPSLETVKRLSILFSVSVDALISYNQAEAISEDITPYSNSENPINYRMNVSNKEVQLIKDLRLLPPSIRNEVYEFLEFKKERLGKKNKKLRKDLS